MTEINFERMAMDCAGCSTQNHQVQEITEKMKEVYQLGVKNTLKENDLVTCVQCEQVYPCSECRDVEDESMCEGCVREGLEQQDSAELAMESEDKDLSETRT